MGKAIRTSLAAALSFSLVVGATSAYAGIGSYASSSSGMSTSGSDAGEKTGSMLQAIVDRFVTVETASAAVADSEPTTAKGKCPEDEGTKVAEGEGEGEDEEKAPVGPEPIYFAF